jgi:hypothetical protein
LVLAHSVSCFVHKLALANIFEMRACAGLIPNRKSAIANPEFRGAAATPGL